MATEPTSVHLRPQLMIRRNQAARARGKEHVHLGQADSRRVEPGDRSTRRNGLVERRGACSLGAARVPASRRMEPLWREIVRRASK